MKKSQDNLVVYVGNLTYDVDENQLEEFFQSEVGNIISTRIIRDASTNQSRGFGFVEFSDRASAAQAIKFNGTDFAGRQLKVNYSEPKRPNSNARRRNHQNRGGYQQPHQNRQQQYPPFPYFYNTYNPVIPNSPPQNQVHTGYMNATTPPQQSYVYPSFCSPQQQLIYPPHAQVHNAAYTYDSSGSLGGTLSNVSSSSDLNKHYHEATNTLPMTVTTPDKNDSSSVLARTDPSAAAYAYAFQPFYTNQQPQNMQTYGIHPTRVVPTSTEEIEPDIIEIQPSMPPGTQQVAREIQPSLPPGGAV